MHACIDSILSDEEALDASQLPSLHRADTEEFARVRVDLGDFSKFVQSHLVQPLNIVCCIIENSGLVLYVYVGDMRSAEYARGHVGVLSYYIPAIAK